MQVNDPRVVEEVSAVFDAYERALLSNDVDTLAALFRDAPDTVRYGLDDAQHGHAEIVAFRRSQSVAAPPRTLVDTVITTFGDDFAVVETEFVPFGSDTRGRQSQAWVRTESGWRIVSAHVSWKAGRAP
jgi:hypothetical protein